MKTLIVGGNGHVGQALSGQLLSLGHSVSCFGSGEIRSAFIEQAAHSDVVFITIPTRDQGETALGYHLDALGLGKRVITCEKGALAYHYKALKPYLQNIGYTATVGGGSRILDLFDRPCTEVERIIGVVNATLNFLFSKCQARRNPYRVLAEAQSLGLCEPGCTDLAGVVNGEIQDLLLKAVNLFNFSGLSDEILHVSEIGSLCISEDEILRQLRRRTRRFFVLVSKKRFWSDNSLYDCLSVWKGEWCIQVIMADVSSFPFKPFPKGQQNALLVESHTGSKQMNGVGAGAAPTAATMVYDMETLFN